jgi:hypothetical protein
MAEVEHDINALEEKIRTAIEELKNLDNGLLEGSAPVDPPAGLDVVGRVCVRVRAYEALIDHLVLARKMQGTLVAGANRVETP